MSNKINEIYSSMTDSEICQAIREMKEDEPKGIVREDGIIRDTCKKVKEITGGNTYEHLLHVQVSLYKEAAYRFTPN